MNRTKYNTPYNRVILNGVKELFGIEYRIRRRFFDLLRSLRMTQYTLGFMVFGSCAKQSCFPFGAASEVFGGCYLSFLKLFMLLLS